MISFQIIVVIVFLVESVLGGSSSYCAPFQRTFAVLCNTCSDWIDFSATQMNECAVSNPVLANGLAYNHECKVDQIMSILANGTARIFHNDNLLPYIVAILNGDVELPFESPLDCIEIELKQISEKIKASKKFGEEVIKGNFVAANVQPDSWCITLQINALTYYNAAKTLIGPQITDFEGLLPTFDSIGMKDILENYLNSNRACDINSFMIGASDIVGASHNEALNYASDTNTEMTYPLSCIKIIVDLGIKQIDSGYTECSTLAQKFNQSSSSSSSSACGNLKETIDPLKNAVLKIFNRIENYTLSNSIANPVLMPAYVNEMNCKIQDLVYATSHATETVVSIPWTDVYNYFYGISQPPYSDQINCIIHDLNEIKNKGIYLAVDFTNSLNNLRVNPEGFDDPSCARILNGVMNYYGQIYQFINDGIHEMQAHYNTFKAINLRSNFIDIITPYQVCVEYGLATIFSNLLNTTYDDTLNLIESAAATSNPSNAPGYPFDCVLGMIYGAVNYTNQEFTEFQANVTLDVN